MFVPRTDDAVAATERKRVEDAIEKLKDEQSGLAGRRAGGRGAEDADRQPGAAAEPSGACQRSGAAARLDAAFRPHRPALRRGAEGDPRDADQDARGRPADQRPGRQARLPGAGPGRAHRGQDLRQRRRRARGRHRHPLPGRRRVVGALLRCAPRHRHQGAGAQAAARAPRQHPAAQRRELGRRRARALHHPPRRRHRRAGAAAGDGRLRAGCAAAAPAPVAGGPAQRRRAIRMAEVARRIRCRREARCAPRRQRRRRRRSRPRRCAPAVETQALPGDLRHRRPRHRAGDGRGQARADRRGPARAGADRAHGAQARPEGLSSTPRWRWRAARRSCRGRSRCSATAPSSATAGCRCWRRARSTSSASASTTRCACATPSPRRSAPRPASSPRPRPTRATIASPSRTCTSGAIPVTVIDQIPVSQNADIKIELLGKTPPTKRDLDDKRGVLAWEMSLQPDEEKVDRVRLPRHLAGGEEDHLRQLTRRGGGYLQLRLAGLSLARARMGKTVQN